MWRMTVLMCTLVACPARGPQGTDTSDSGLPPVTDDTGDTNPGTAPIDVSACLAGPSTPGPWDDHPLALADATITDAAPAADAGLAAIAAAAEGKLDPFTLDPPLAVTGAVVTAVDFVPGPPNDGTATFWLEDAQTALVAFRVQTTPGIEPTELAPGDVVSFTATEVQDYFDKLEILEVTDFQVTSTAPVRVFDGNDGAALDYAVQGQRVVEVWGGLSTQPEACGGDSVCFDFVYNGGTVLFRTESVFDRPGDCIHYIGPLGTFSGAPQIDALNFDWYQSF